MGIFRKRREAKAQQESAQHYNEMMEELQKPYCKQKGHYCEYRDFPPFLTYEWHGGNGEGKIAIKEKYCCIYCHEVITKTLSELTYDHYTREDFDKDLEEIRKTYKDILKPRGIVEDMIYDSILVDRQKLEIWDKLHSPKKPEKEPFEFKINERNHGEIIK